MKKSVIIACFTIVVLGNGLLGHARKPGMVEKARGLYHSTKHSIKNSKGSFKTSHLSDRTPILVNRALTHRLTTVLLTFGLVAVSGLSLHEALQHALAYVHPIGVTNYSVTDTETVIDPQTGHVKTPEAITNMDEKDYKHLVEGFNDAPALYKEYLSKITASDYEKMMKVFADHLKGLSAETHLGDPSIKVENEMDLINKMPDSIKNYLMYAKIDNQDPFHLEGLHLGAIKIGEGAYVAPNSTQFPSLEEAKVELQNYHAYKAKLLDDVKGESAQGFGSFLESLSKMIRK